MILILNQNDLSSYTKLIANCPASNAKRYQHYVNKRVALALFLRQYTSIELPLTTLVTDNGKPYLDKQEFAFSDTNDLDGIALDEIGSHYSLGMDLERIRRRSNIKALCERFLSTAEQEYLQDFADLDLGFLLLFSLRESLIKCFATRLFAMNDFKIDPHCQEIKIAAPQVHKLNVDLSLYRARALSFVYRGASYVLTYCSASTRSDVLIYESILEQDKVMFKSLELKLKSYFNFRLVQA